MISKSGTTMNMQERGTETQTTAEKVNLHITLITVPCIISETLPRWGIHARARPRRPVPQMKTSNSLRKQTKQLYWTTTPALSVSCATGVCTRSFFVSLFVSIRKPQSLPTFEYNWKCRCNCLRKVISARNVFVHSPDQIVRMTVNCGLHLASSQ